MILPVPGPGGVRLPVPSRGGVGPADDAHRAFDPTARRDDDDPAMPARPAEAPRIVRAQRVDDPRLAGGAPDPTGRSGRRLDTFA